MSDPDSWLVPDFVIAFTCTPDDRPWVASKRFEMNWNSAIASLLYRGWLPAPMFALTCMPSTFRLNSRTSPRSCTGVAPSAFVRLPGASSASDIQLRPALGSSCICRGSIVPPIDDDCVEMRGASPVTVTVSCSVDGDICRFSVSVWPTSSSTP